MCKKALYLCVSSSPAVSAYYFLSIHHFLSFTNTRKPKYFLLLDLKLWERPQFHEFCLPLLFHHLQRPPHSLSNRINKAMMMVCIWANSNCSSSFPPLCFTEAKKELICHLKPSYPCNNIKTLKLLN